MNNVIEVTDATFASEVLGASKPVLVDYWADWCAPCKQLSPIIEELAGTYGCLLYTSPSPRDGLLSRMPSSA